MFGETDMYVSLMDREVAKEGIAVYFVNEDGVTYKQSPSKMGTTDVYDPKGDVSTRRESGRRASDSEGTWRITDTSGDVGVLCSVVYESDGIWRALGVGVTRRWWTLDGQRGHLTPSNRMKREELGVVDRVPEYKSINK